MFYVIDIITYMLKEYKAKIEILRDFVRSHLGQASTSLQMSREYMITTIDNDKFAARICLDIGNNHLGWFEWNCSDVERCDLDYPFGNASCFIWYLIDLSSFFH